MPTFKGDSSISPVSGSGITVGDETVEEWLARKQAQEIGEELTPDRVNPYHKGSNKITLKKDPDGVGRVWTRREINMEHWEKRLMSSKNIDEAVISTLLSGREVSGNQLRDCVFKAGLGVTRKQYDVRTSYLMHQTDFGKLVDRRREGKGVAYKLATAALDCRPEELMVFVYKKAKPRETVLQHHKALRPYFEPEPDQTTSKADTEQKADTSDLSKVQTSKNAISATLETALTDLLGVNVNVSGRIEIVFKIGD